MANVFANSANLILTAFFFHPLLPLSIPIALVGYFFSYWVNKVDSIKSYSVFYLQYLLLRRNKRPEEMSGLMARFFANLLPEIAFIWTLSISLFYRRVYFDFFHTGVEVKILPLWITLIVVGIFILLPIRTWINRSFDSNVNNPIPYSQKCFDFISDYD